MKNGEFASDAAHGGWDQTVNTFGIGGPGMMQVSMAFTEQADEEDEDVIAYFNKRERFQDWAPFLPEYMQVCFWDLTQNFGYTKKKDGTCEVYHSGEYFFGPWPIRLVFTAHAAYVAWAARRFIESDSFGNPDRLEEAELQRKNIPKQVFGEFLVGLSAALEEQKGKITPQQEATLNTLKEASRNTKLRSYASVIGTPDVPSRLQLEVSDPQVEQAIRAALAQLNQGDSRAAGAQLELLLTKAQTGGLQRQTTAGAEALKRKIIRRQSTLGVQA